jgi:hypothetical protein
VAIPLSAEELALVERAAWVRGLETEAAAQMLLSEALARRVRKRTGHGPSGSVLAFRRGAGR